MTTVGLCLPQLTGRVTRDAVRSCCQRAEELGFAGLWAQEHLILPARADLGLLSAARPADPRGLPEHPLPLETLTAAAAWTIDVTIGTSVLVGGYHRPVDLAKRLATLDLLSGGRLIVGFSVGWSDDEHAQMDVDPRTRGRRLDELLDALDACWGPDPVTFSGEFFEIPPSDVRPKPIQQPRPRLLSGMRSAAGLRRTAQRFDIWNPASGTIEEILDTAAALQQERPADMSPLEVYWRVYVEPPVRVAHLRPLSVDELCETVTQAKIASVIVDANFSPDMDSPDAWAELPQRLSPLLDAAR